ncbi:MAG: two-component system response regulator [Sphingobium sp.]|nr:two-component system response regulator [Sphingobium sp.]
MAKRVLVVEDNELNLKLFCDLLRAHGFETEGVRDGREAVARARAFAPDLLITDIQLPHVSGYDLIAQVRGDLTLRTTPILAVTAYASRTDEERIRAAGANAYVSKPIALAAFMAEVKALLPTSEEPHGTGPAAL